MSFDLISARLTEQQKTTATAVKKHAESLLNHTPRFKFFTLHGSAHIENLFGLLEIFLAGGVQLTQQELFLLAIAICVHDLGMVVGLRESDVTDILEGRPEYPDAAALENFIRESHHDLIEKWLRDHPDFLLSLGFNPTELALVREISRCHRKLVLSAQHGVIQYLGALLRVLDELDLGANRAPADVLFNLYDEMDATSCWHWFKHNIAEDWLTDHNVKFRDENNRRRIVFKLTVWPSKESSIPYWLNQIKRPITKALIDDEAQRIIKDKFAVEVRIESNRDGSGVNKLDKRWQAIEERALSAGRKVIIVIDDEFRKIEDLFLPLMDRFHLLQAVNAKDAITKLEAANVDLAIIDLQLGSGFIWSAEETQDFKATGFRLCQHIKEAFPHTKIGILTGSFHEMPDISNLGLQFLLKKPIDPSELLEKVSRVLV